MNSIKLKDIAKYSTNRTSSPDYYLSTKNMNKHEKGVYFPCPSIPNQKTYPSYSKGDILISNIRPYFKKIWQAKVNGARSNDILDIKSTSPLINQSYLYYALQSNAFFEYVTRTAKGTKMPRGDKDSIMEYKIPLRSLEIQEKIVYFISSLDNKVTLNEQIDDNLVKLLNLHFIKFSNSLHQNSNKNKIVKLSNIAHRVKDRAKKKHLIYKAYIPINKIPKHQLFSYDYESNSKAKSSLVYFKKGDILFGAMRPYFHRLMVAPFNGITRTTTIVIRPNKTKDLPFLAMRLFQDDFIKYAYSNCKGSTMPYDTWDTIKDFKFIMPSKLIKFNKIFTVIKSYISNLNIENLKLFRLRQLLLLKFFN